MIKILEKQALRNINAGKMHNLRITINSNMLKLPHFARKM